LNELCVAFNDLSNMKIHEYQGKQILRQFGIPTPRGMACFNVAEAVAAAQQLGGNAWVVKRKSMQVAVARAAA